MYATAHQFVFNGRLQSAFLARQEHGKHRQIGDAHVDEARQNGSFVVSLD
ncbi:MAG: hypothetical protein AB7Q45_02285 [Planctomycetaceae bacterium]